MPSLATWIFIPGQTYFGGTIRAKTTGNCSGLKWFWLDAYVALADLGDQTEYATQIMRHGQVRRLSARQLFAAVDGKAPKPSHAGSSPFTEL